MVLDGKELGFCVMMVNGDRLHTPNGDPEGGVLEALEFLDGGGEGVGEPDGGGVGEEGGDEGFVGSWHGGMYQYRAPNIINKLKL